MWIHIHANAYANDALFPEMAQIPRCHPYLQHFLTVIAIQQFRIPLQKANELEILSLNLGRTFESQRYYASFDRKIVRPSYSF